MDIEKIKFSSMVMTPPDFPVPVMNYLWDTMRKVNEVIDELNQEASEDYKDGYEDGMNAGFDLGYEEAMGKVKRIAEED